MWWLGVTDVAANVANGIVDVAVGNNQIQAAVQIEIGETAAEAQSYFGRSADPGRERHVIELSGGRRTVQSNHFIVEVGDGDSGAARIFEVADIDAHACAGLSVGAESEACFNGGIFEFSVAQIAIEFVGLSVVGDEKIGPAILIEVEHGNAERF